MSLFEDLVLTLWHRKRQKHERLKIEKLYEKEYNQTWLSTF